MANEAYLKTWNIYQSAWSDLSAERRRFLLAKSVAENCVYSDPTDYCGGVNALITHIEGTQSKVPGASFRNDTLLVHHDQGLSNWTMFDGKGEVVATGTSYARFHVSSPKGLVLRPFQPATLKLSHPEQQKSSPTSACRTRTLTRGRRSPLPR